MCSELADDTDGCRGTGVAGKEGKHTLTTNRFGTHDCPLATAALSRSRHQEHCFLAYLEGHDSLPEIRENLMNSHHVAIARCRRLDVVSWRRLAATTRTFRSLSELLKFGRPGRGDIILISNSESESVSAHRHQ